VHCTRCQLLQQLCEAVATAGKGRGEHRLRWIPAEEVTSALYSPALSSVRRQRPPVPPPTNTSSLINTTSPPSNHDDETEESSWAEDGHSRTSVREREAEEEGTGDVTEQHLGDFSFSSPKSREKGRRSVFMFSSGVVAAVKRAAAEETCKAERAQQASAHCCWRDVPLGACRRHKLVRGGGTAGKFSEGMLGIDVGDRARLEYYSPEGSAKEVSGRGEADGGVAVEGGDYRVLLLDVKYEWVDSVAGMQHLLDHLQNHLSVEPPLDARNLAETGMAPLEQEKEPQRQAGFAEISGERAQMEEGAGGEVRIQGRGIDRGQAGGKVFVGMDCEWGAGLTPSIIQLSILGRVFVVDCNIAVPSLHDSCFPSTAPCAAELYAEIVRECVILIFSHAAISVVGFAFKRDLDKLVALVPQLASLQFPPNKIIDLQHIALGAWRQASRRYTPACKQEGTPVFTLSIYCRHGADF